MGYLCYIFLILLGGAFGGAIYSLTTENSHRVRIPWFRNATDWETGCTGHIFIGAFAGLILVSIAIGHFNFNVNAAIAEGVTPFRSPVPLGRDGMLVAIHTIAISVIGGFLGLKLITKIAEKTVEELDGKIGSLAGKLQEKDQADIAYRHAALARVLCSEKDYISAEEESKKSLEIMPTRFGEFVSGLILKRRDKLRAAIEALDRAQRLPPDTYVPTDATICWNRGCYFALLEPLNLTDVFGNIDKSIEIKPHYKEDILTDRDLKGLLDNPEFQKHYNIQKRDNAFVFSK